MTELTKPDAIDESFRASWVRMVALSSGKPSKQYPLVSSMRLLATGPKEYYRLSKSYFNGILKELQKTVCISEHLSKLF